MVKSFTRAILFSSLILFATQSCNKDKKGPDVPEEETAPPTSPAVHIDPWDTMGFAENTPLAIKKEIYNWRQGLCTFADLNEYRFLEQRVYLLKTGCSNDPLTYLYDTTAKIMCALDGSMDPECHGTSFSEAYNKRFIWSTYKVFPASISSVKLVNSQVALGDRTFIEVRSLGASDGQCIIDRYEVKLVGQTYFIKTYYKLPKSPSAPIPRQTELRSNIEIIPPAPGVYVLRADSTSSIADTLTVF